MRVFLDSNVIRHSAKRYRTQTIHYGQLKAGDPLVSYGPVVLHQKKEHPHPKLAYEIGLLHELAIRLKTANASILIDKEAHSEIRHAGSFRGRYFYGNEIITAVPPLDYVIGYGPLRIYFPGPTKNPLHNILAKIEDKRFNELAKATHGRQDGGVTNYNQLVDAFFLWCAEHNHAEYFLTLDFKLKSYVQTAKSLSYKPRIVTPSELLNSLART